jgi:PAS domain S-box-containing protein
MSDSAPSEPLPYDHSLIAAINAAPMLVCVIDRDSNIVFVNDSVCELTGFSREEIHGQSAFDLIDPEFRDYGEKDIARVWNGETSDDHFNRWITKDGRKLLISWNSRRVGDVDGDGEPSYIVGLGLDITHLSQLERERYAAEQRFRTVFHDAPAGMIICSVEPGRFGLILAANDAAAQISGQSEEHLVGRSIAKFVPPVDIDARRARILQWLEAGAPGPLRMEVPLITPFEQGRVVDVQMRLLHSEQEGKFVIIHVLQVSRSQHDTHNQPAIADSSTQGTLDEAEFLVRLREVTPSRCPLAVLRIRVFGVNDVRAVYGFAAADRFVAGVADKLAEVCPDSSTIARVSADTFAVFFETSSSYERVSEISVQLNAASVKVHNRNVFLSTAIGVAPCVKGDSSTAEILHAAAGAALEEASRGRRGTIIEIPGTEYVERAQKRIYWQARLRSDIADNRLLLYSQSIHWLRRSGVAFRELTVRALDEKGKLVFPSAFLPIADDTGQIGDVDKWVLARAIEVLAREAHEHFAMRVSGTLLSNDQAFTEFFAILRAGQACAPRLVFEVGGLSNPTAETLRNINHLIEFGSRLLLSHSGVGASPYFYMKNFPLSFIKIHSSVTRDLLDDYGDRLATQGIIDLSHGQGLMVVGEHIETSAAVNLLVDMGMDLGQGFYFGRPEQVRIH